MSKSKVTKNLWFAFHFNDYLNDTAGLPLLQHGAYVMCILAYYRSSKPLPADLTSLYRMVGAFTEEEQAATKFVIERFFKLESGVYRHPRIDIELSDISDRRVKAQSSAHARWNKADAEAVESIVENITAISDFTPQVQAALAAVTHKLVKGYTEKDALKVGEAMGFAMGVLRKQGFTEEQIVGGLDWIQHNALVESGGYDVVVIDGQRVRVPKGILAS